MGMAPERRGAGDPVLDSCLRTADSLRVRSLVWRLPFRQREVVVRHVFRDEFHARIARDLGLKTAAVQKRWERARRSQTARRPAAVVTAPPQRQPAWQPASPLRARVGALTALLYLPADPAPGAEPRAHQAAGCANAPPPASQPMPA